MNVQMNTFWVDLCFLRIYLVSHECIEVALVLEEGSVGVPRSDSLDLPRRRKGRGGTQRKMKDYLNQLSNEVIGAAIEVHRDLGPRLLETSYELSLQHELRLRGIESARQVILPIRYKDLVVPEAYRIDLRVENCLVVELKTVEALLPIHSAQLLTYLRMSNCHLGFLINFHTVRLKDGIKRLVHDFPS